MTDKPIPFSGPMVRALLEGRKTQTRRVIKEQPKIDWDKLFKVGDRLWVREAWRATKVFDAIPPRDMLPRAKEAGFLDPVAACLQTICYEADQGESPLDGRYRPAMFMPRWASRFTLTVTDVRVQRVQEISAEDARDEGVEHDGIGYVDYLHPDDPNAGFAGVRAAYHSFESLWDSLNEKHGFGWAANPWVAAYTFTVEKRNIDA